MGQVGMEYHEEESAAKLKLKRENKNFAKQKIEVEQMSIGKTESQEMRKISETETPSKSQCQCEGTGDLADTSKENTIMEEEEVTEDYTDIEALETIQEVSEVYDTSEQTDMTETEFIEDIDDFPTFNLNDVDILDAICKDIHEPTKLIVNPIKDVIDDEPVVSEAGSFDLIPSLQCHFMNSLEYESERLPSSVAHQVSNENTEETDFLSQISHHANTVQQHVFYLKNYPQVGMEYHEEESAAKLKLKRENKNFAKQKIEVEQMSIAKTESQEM